MGETNFEAIVIGTGPGGSSCATLLQKRGLKTLCLEKNDFVGGKMGSIEKDGYAYDIFPHGQVPMTKPSFRDVFEELGVLDEWAPMLSKDDPRDVAAIAYRRRDWEDYAITRVPQAMADPGPFFDVWKLSDAEKMQAVQFMAKLATMPPSELDTLDDVTMHDYLMRHGDQVPHAVYSYLAYHSNASLAEPIDLVAASEQIKIMKDIMLDGGGGQYRGGFGYMANIMMREFERNGGTLLMKTPADRILVEHGQVVGVATKHGEFRAPVVISTAGLQPTVLKLIGEQHFAPDYVKYVRDLLPGWGFITTRYFLKEPVMDVAMYAIYSDESWWNVERFNEAAAGKMPEEVAIFACNHSFYDDRAAPPGKQVLLAGCICSPDPTAEYIAELHDIMDRQMERTFPEIIRACERKEKAGPREVSAMTRAAVLPGQGGECCGVGQIAGQVGTMKPDSNAPLDGLYIAGADAGSVGMGTHGASISGRRVVDMVQQYVAQAAAE